MNYKITGESFPVLTLELSAGESIKASSGAVGWMNERVTMTSGISGGLLKGIRRVLAGEKLFLCRYKSEKGGGRLSIPSSLPGCIIPLTLEDGKGIIAQKKAFMCGEETIELDIAFAKKLRIGFFGGEGFILQRIKGKGKVFFEIDGSVTEYVLDTDEILRVDTGHIAMFEDTITYDIALVKGVKNMFFGGEGFFWATLQGPGKVWLQSMPLKKLASLIVPFVPGAKN